MQIFCDFLIYNKANVKKNNKSGIGRNTHQRMQRKTTLVIIYRDNHSKATDLYGCDNQHDHQRSLKLRWH